MANITEKCFSINLRVMSLLRMYPPEKNTLFFRLQAYTAFIMLIPPAPIFGFLFFVFEKDYSVAQLNDNAFVIAELACQITKYAPFIINGLRIKKCIHFFESSLFTVHNEKQKEIIEESCRICRRNSMIFLRTVCVGIAFFAVRPIFNVHQKFPVDVWLPINVTSESILFYFIYIYLAVGVGYTALACGVIDPLIGGLACLATGQVLVLKDNLQHITQYTQKGMPDVTQKLIIKSFIQQCVDCHNGILEFLAEYEKCFSLSMFSQSMGGILVICFCCLQLSKLDLMSFEFLSMILFSTTALAQIYVYCHYCTQLFEETDTLTNLIYMGEWYNYDRETKKSLTILMERSRKPVVITAGKILEISIETFVTILRRSYSLLCVLQNL